NRFLDKFTDFECRSKPILLIEFIVDLMDNLQNKSAQQYKLVLERVMHSPRVARVGHVDHGSGRAHGGLRARGI
ncbi:6409_t:CDS:2, partial [Racocetra fulgida]